MQHIANFLRVMCSHWGYFNLLATPSHQRCFSSTLFAAPLIAFHMHHYTAHINKMNKPIHKGCHEKRVVCEHATSVQTSLLKAIFYSKGHKGTFLFLFPSILVWFRQDPIFLYRKKKTNKKKNVQSVLISQ